MHDSTQVGSEIGPRFFSLYSLIKDDEARQTYETPFPQFIPVMYRREAVATAELCGYKYVYTLPHGVEEKIIAGDLETHLGRDLVLLPEVHDFPAKYRIVAIDLRDQSPSASKDFFVMNDAGQKEGARSDDL